MPAPYTGGCQCGAVRYELAAEPLTIVACHCSECQRQSASAFGMSLFVPAEALRLTRGETRQWRRKADSGREMICHFCDTCGSRVYHEPIGVPAYTLRAGTLDDTSWVRPVGHLWLENAQPWVQVDPEALAYETQPEGGFGPLIERYAERTAAAAAG